ncbi:hypothetical protein AQUCO_02300052v1 [Aquilegia coerulea]|uniref:Legume lectin domain-containing protein n=1 Tax=Aquilegia coerulea TaxID=218851 RepID=A0A2G5DBV2_AQUCA|nr:hypothetical protein AQUCO_02300052v1 [Aquilegia coerulea]
MAFSWIFSLLVIFSFFAIGANARPGVHFHPCKTIFISSFTVSSYKFQNPNPNNQIQNPNNQFEIQIQNPPRFFTIFDFYPTQKQEEIQLQQQPFEIFLDRRLPSFNSEQFLLPRSVIPFRLEKPAPRHPAAVLPSFGGVTSSLRDRTKDILSVVVALLFGVGCGALTSATMYLAWTLITNRYQAHRDYQDDSDFSSDDEDVNPKKMGYCKIPDDVPAVIVAVPAPAAKQVV